MYINQDMHLNQLTKTKTVFLKKWKSVCVLLSQLIITSFFSKLILTMVLGDYKIFKLGLLHIHMQAWILEPELKSTLSQKYLLLGKKKSWILRTLKYT